MVVLLYLIGWTYFGKIKVKIAMLMFVIIHVVLPIVWFYSYAYKSCDGEWKKGLKNSMMLNGDS